MAIKFPGNPSNGDTVTRNSVVYTYQASNNRWSPAIGISSTIDEVAGLDSAEVLALTGGGGSGLTTYTSLDSLPSSGLTLGDQAFISSARRLYVSDGNGWYSVAVANAAPYWDSAPLSEYTIEDSETPLVITALAKDSDNPFSHLTNQSFASDSAQYMVDISIDSSVFTFTPKSKDSIGQEVAAGNLADSNGDFTYTFKWTDGVSVVSSPAVITYNTAGGFGPVTYVARVTGVANEASSFPTTSFMTSTWGHNGGNADGVTLNISGSGQYQLYSISMGRRISNTGGGVNLSLRVTSGNTSSGTLIASESITYPGLIDTTSSYSAQELVFPTPVTLNRGTTYSVMYAVSSPLGVQSGAIDTDDGVRATYNLSSNNGGGTITWGSVTYNASDPFDTSNGTHNDATGRGQLQIFGLKFPA